MLETFNQDRGTGKTTKVIELLKEDLKAILVIPIKTMKEFYPKEFHHRILTATDISNGYLHERIVSKVVLDEGFMYDKEKLAHLYYLLGYEHINVLSYGTV
jgi:cobalamin biosynthesis Co2+ chelatase CbiK